VLLLHFGLPKRRSTDSRHFGLPKLQCAEDRRFGLPKCRNSAFWISEKPMFGISDLRSRQQKNFCSAYVYKSQRVPE